MTQGGGVRSRDQLIERYEARKASEELEPRFLGSDRVSMKALGRQIRKRSPRLTKTAMTLKKGNADTPGAIGITFK